MILRLVTTSLTTSCSRPGVEVLRVLAEDDHVDVRVLVARLQTRQLRTGRTLANRSSCLRRATLTLWNPPAIGVVTGPFKPDAGALQRIEHVLRQISPLDCSIIVACQFDALPFDRDAGGLDGANGGVGDFGSDAVAGNQT